MSQTRLAFDAKIAGITIKPAKDTHARGHFDLALTIEQPDPPPAPPIPWQFAASGDRSKWGPRPEADNGTEDENRVRREQEQYDDARASYREAWSQYQERLATYRDRVLIYAQVVGIASVFGNQSVAVLITPLNQDLIPGFAAELTSEATQSLQGGSDEDQSARPT